jgi:hypothetical protein
MKCQCGNEFARARVKPFPVSFVDVKTKKTMEILYMAGFSKEGLCWFCTFPR